MNEGMFNEIKRRLDELITLNRRLIELMESQTTQPVQHYDVIDSHGAFVPAGKPAKTTKATKSK